MAESERDGSSLDLLASSSELVASSSHLLSSDEEEDELSPQALLCSLRSLWMNEKLCPELLPVQQSVLEALNDALAHLQMHRTRDIRGSLHRLEQSRIQFMIKDYHRVRLNKLQNLALATLKADEEKLLLSWMSREEQQFFTKYRQIVHNHFESSVLNRLPGDFKQFPVINEDETAVNPNRTVFVEPTDKLEGKDKTNKQDVSLVITLDDDEDGARSSEVNTEIKKGSRHVLPYMAVREQLLEGKLTLF